MNLTDEQIERYSRHIILEQVGGKGQMKLLESSVLIVGAGGLGSPVALYLAAAGVGTIGIIDADNVDLTNLQRQVIHTTKDVGAPKVYSAKETMLAINPGINVITYPKRLNAANALEILKDYQFVIDGTDNFASKFLVADACHFADKPYSHAGILRFNGQVTTVIPRKSTCYRCMFRKMPPEGAVPSCSQAGVLGVLACVIGGIQATEAIKYFLGKGELLTNHLLTYDALKMSFRKVAIKKSENCPLCGKNPTITELIYGKEAVCALKSDGNQA